MRPIFITAALLLTGGAMFFGCNREEGSSAPPPASNAAPASTPGQKVGGAIDATTQKVGSAATQIGGALSPTGANNLDGVRNAVAEMTDKATVRNDFKDVAGYFTKADEDRVVASKPDTKDLDDLVEAFGVAYKAKYGHSFKVDAEKDFPPKFLSLSQDPADPNKAVATIMDMKFGVPGLIMHFLREGSLWKLKIDDTVDGKILHEHLISAFTELNKGAPSWPDDAVAADQAITLRIFQAILAGA